MVLGPSYLSNFFATVSSVARKFRRLTGLSSFRYRFRIEVSMPVTSALLARSGGREKKKREKEL